MKITDKLATGQKGWIILPLLLLFCLPLSAQHTLTLEDMRFYDGRITDYYGEATDIIIPAELKGERVTHIGDEAFVGRTKVIRK